MGLLLAATNMLLLAGLSAANPRRASNWNLLFALLTFVVYFNVINLSQAWVASGRMEMGADARPARRRVRARAGADVVARAGQMPGCGLRCAAA